MRDAPQARWPDTAVIACEKFDTRRLLDWRFERGAGAALIAGAALGVMVGLVIVAQTRYSSTGEHIGLRALGAFPGFIRRLILTQAAPSTAMGYAMGILLSLLAVYFLRDAKLLDAKLLIVMTTNSGLLLLALTVGVYVSAPISTIKMSRMMTCVDAAVVLAGRGRQGHGTNPGS